MQSLIKFNSSKTLIRILYLAFFLIMLLLNILTPYILDDWGYMFNFSTGEMLDNILEIIPSMIAHSKTMNGRLISHGLEQLFMLVPKLVFNLCNSFMYLLMLLLIYKYTCRKEDNALILLGIFMSIWVFTPTFGQNFLWQVGSVNYLWGIVLGLFFFKSFVDALLYDETEKSKLIKALYIIGSFFAGAYIEGVASIVLLGGAILTILLRIKTHKFTWHCFQWIFSAVGFVFLISQPAELSKKVSSNAFQFSNLIRNICDLTGITRDYFLILITLWLILFVISIAIKTEKMNIIVSTIFFFLSFVSVYEMSIASEISLRCFALTLILLIIAIVILLNKIPNKPFIACVIMSLSPIFFTRFIMGSIDVYNYFLNVKYRESIIQECKQSGEYDINIPYIYTKTNYCTTNSTMEISFDPNTWPNVYMAEYYGVSSLTGY